VLSINPCIGDITSFIYLMAFFVIGFVCSFWRMVAATDVADSDNYKDLIDTAFTLAKAAPAPKDYADYDSMNALGTRSVYGNTLLICYVLLVAVILVNLLIAMMGDTYTALQENQQTIINHNSAMLRMSYIGPGHRLPTPCNLVALALYGLQVLFCYPLPGRSMARGKGTFEDEKDLTISCTDRFRFPFLSKNHRACQYCMSSVVDASKIKKNQLTELTDPDGPNANFLVVLAAKYGLNLLMSADGNATKNGLFVTTRRPIYRGTHQKAQKTGHYIEANTHVEYVTKESKTGKTVVTHYKLARVHGEGWITDEPADDNSQPPVLAYDDWAGMHLRKKLMETLTPSRCWTSWDPAVSHNVRLTTVNRMLKHIGEQGTRRTTHTEYPKILTYDNWVGSNVCGGLTARDPDLVLCIRRYLIGIAVPIMLCAV
jgi:hypothetical protein